jgi:hypothetical protein
MSGIWQRLRGQWFRILLVVLSLGLIIGAISVVFQPPPAVAKATPLPVGANEYEIAWLYPAVNTSTWERFVAAMRSASERLTEKNNVEFEIGDSAFPLQTTAVPEVAIRWRDSGRRLVFRWYKLTSSSKTRDWVEALAHRVPPPVAVIGGGNSYSGLELARQMKRVCLSLPEEMRPLLLFTTATVDRAAASDGDDAEAPDVEVNDIYPDRTFRFCFTNRQMAFATTRFLWQHDDMVYNRQPLAELWFPPMRLFRAELRPTADPVFQVAWEDDSYSRDLLTGYEYARRALEAQALAREWISWTSNIGIGTLPLTGGTLPGDHLWLEVKQQPIYSSVGTYHAPNQFESTAVHYLLDQLNPLPKQRRMLIVAGQFQPTRRFLQSLARAAPDAPPRLVVVTGDTISFNHIYRDRLAAWRTQELPFPLVFFCHRNPIDPAAGFDPAHGQTTGTEDVLLFRDIVETVEAAFGRTSSPNPDAAVIGENLRAVRLLGGRFGFETSGVALFSKEGKRNGGTGEHVVYLRPLYKGDLVLSEAQVEVWTRDAAPGVRPFWRLVGGLRVPDPQIELDRGVQP